MDFQKIYSQIEQNEYPISIMENLLRFTIGFACASNLDLNMGHMSMPLNEPMRNILTLIMPFELFECLVLPEGISLVTNIYQG